MEREYFASSSLVLYVIRIVGFHKRSYYRRPYGTFLDIELDQSASNFPKDIKLSFSEGERLTEIEHDDVFVFKIPLQLLELVVEATDGVARFTVAQPDCDVFRFYSVSAVGRSQDASLVQDGSTAGL